MAQLGQAFNVNSVEPIGELGAIPAGWYHAQISKTERKITNKKDGAFIAFEYTIINHPKFKNRKVYENLNIENKNQSAVEIAYRTLAAIGIACSVETITDTTQLHNIPFDIQLGIENGGVGDDGKTYNDRNSILAYRKYGQGENVDASMDSVQPTTAPNNPLANMQQQAPAMQQPVYQPVPQPQPVAQPAPQPEPVLQATEKAGQYSIDDYIKSGWTQEQLIEQGMAILVYPQVQQAPAQQAPMQPPQVPSTSAPWLNSTPPGQAQQAPLQQPSPANQTATPPWVTK
jgi:hypothetical protein